MTALSWQAYGPLILVGVTLVYVIGTVLLLFRSRKQDSLSGYDAQGHRLPQFQIKNIRTQISSQGFSPQAELTRKSGRRTTTT